MLIKQNFRTFKLINKENDITGTNIVPNSLIQEIITYNITIVEFYLILEDFYMGIILVN